MELIISKMPCLFIIKQTENYLPNVFVTITTPDTKYDLEVNNFEN